MLPLCIIVILWSSLGTSLLVFVAGFQGVDRSLYEAGAVDGITNRFAELYICRSETQLMVRLSITGSCVEAVTVLWGSEHGLCCA